jgi:hypothetical protein
MKKIYKLLLSFTLIILLHSYAAAQTSLGASKLFLSKLKASLVNAKPAKPGSTVISLKVADKKEFKAKINFKQSGQSEELLMGEIDNVSGSSFYVKVKDKFTEGHIILKKTKEAYKYYSDEKGNAFVNKVDINSLICIDYEKANQNITTSTAPALAAEIAPALLNLQSLPGAAGCLMLDFDGYFMPAGNLWNNGNAINAAPSGMSDADVQQSWEVTSEDYRPFNVNVTTNEAVFNSYPKNRRMRIVITTTSTAAPGSGGVAYLGSFNWDNDVPCWVFNIGGKLSGETISHEAGHTFDLAHDGRNNPKEEYFSGLANTPFAPIMGAGYSRPVSQWSKGEYDRANNFQDDVATIAGSKFGVGYRGDDYSNGTGGAANLAYGADGGITYKTGFIASESDIDFFTFTTGGGNVTINANTVSRDGNLDIIIRLYNQTGAEIGNFTNTAAGALNAALNTNLGAGTYYVSIDGTGAGSPASGGYSAYASIGSYSITGNIPPGGGNPTSTTGLVTAYVDCPYTGFSIGLEQGDYNEARLRSLGMAADRISSIRAAEGYEVILYDLDNFGGASIVTGTSGCLDAVGFNDKAASLRVRTKGNPGITGTYFLQNRSSNLYMDVQGGTGATGDGANIQQWNTAGTTNQQFKFDHLGDGTYKITAVHSGKVVDVSGISKADGANVFQYTYYGTPNQQFIMVPTNNGYYKLIAKHSGKVVEVAGCSAAAEANVQQWSNNGQPCSEWKLVPVGTTNNNFSVLIQAENYSTMKGIQTEPTTDAGGGQNVGYTDAGDFMAYNNINFPTSGAYLIEYRVASAVNGARISSDLNAGAIQLGSILNVPNTGGWQNWQTISQTVNINAGTYNFGIFIQTGGANINWIRISKVATAATATIATTAPAASSSAAVKAEAGVYPNPVSNTLIFTAQMSGTMVKIVNQVGETVLQQKVNNNNSIDISKLNTGIYFIVTTKNGKQTVQKFVKK